MKILFKFGAILACIQFLNQSAHSQEHPFDGFYMGIDGTYDKFDYVSTTIVTSPGSDLINIPPTGIYNTDQQGAGIFIGYRGSRNNFTIAAEGRYGTSFTSNTVSATNSFKSANEFGASILPGYWISNNIVVFGRVGFSQLTLNRNFLSGVFNNSDTGLHLGGGIQLYATDKISLRADYTKTTYNHRMNQTVTIDPGEETERLATVIFYNNLKRDRFQISLIANF